MYGSLWLQDHTHVKTCICRRIEFPASAPPACSLAPGNDKCPMSGLSHHSFFLGSLVRRFQFIINIYLNLRIIQKQADSLLRQTVRILRKHISFIRSCFYMIPFFPERLYCLPHCCPGASQLTSNALTGKHFSFILLQHFQKT